MDNHYLAGNMLRPERRRCCLEERSITLLLARLAVRSGAAIAYEGLTACKCER